VYVAVGKLSLMLAFLHPSASPVWPPTGLALALLLLFGMRFWPAILIGAFLVNATTEGSIATSMAIACGNTLEAVIGAFLVEQFAGGARAFERVNGVLAFAFLAGVVSTIVSATIGVMALVLGRFAPPANVIPMLLTWWLGDAVGALVVAPLLILWYQDFRIRWNMQQALEVATLFAILGLMGVAIFGSEFFGASRQPLAYLILVPVLWAATRFGRRETMALVFALSSIAIVGTLRGFGPFFVSSANTSLVLLQSFMGVVAVIGLALAVALEERRVFEASLERKIDERTRELALARDKDRANLLRLRDMIDRMTIGALAADEHLAILHANEPLRRIFRLRSDQGRSSLSDLLHESRHAFLDPHVSLATLQRLLESREQALNLELVLTDGKILSCDYIPISDGGMHRGHLLLCRDVTEEKRIDKAKSEFMSLASHQLRTPLTGIRWALGKIEKALPEDIGEENLKLVCNARSATVRLCEMIDTMLDITRIEAGQFDVILSEVPIKDFLRNISALYRDEYERKRLTIAIDCNDELSVHTDVSFLTEILSNLLSNAVKYTQSGGDILLRAERERSSVRVDVEDTGIGIPFEEQENIFRKFFRATNARVADQDGTGLGLYFARSAAALLNGQLTFVSEPGRGTMFSLLLPVYGREMMGSEKRSEEITESQR
jgi:signal transduction histidine kinase